GSAGALPPSSTRRPGPASAKDSPRPLAATRAPRGSPAPSARGAKGARRGGLPPAPGAPRPAGGAPPAPPPPAPAPPWAGGPSPLHLAGGLLRYRLLSLVERLSALRAGLALMGMRRRRDPRLANCTVDAVLGALGQSEHARASFWNPVAVATLNESPERAAAGPFVGVLGRAFFRSRADSQFVLPRVGLGELYTDDARRFVEQRGGHVWIHAQAAALDVTGDAVRGVVLRDGRRLDADGCVAAVPPA